MKESFVSISNEFDFKTIFNELNPSKIGVLVDENTQEYCLPFVLKKSSLPFEIIRINSGEQNKTLDTCESVWEQLVTLQFDRSSVLILLGGGVLGDLGGFCSATYMRGMRFIHMPTTLLAMVDSCLGGKLGVDFMGYKNMIGIFKTAEHTIINPDFLHSLPNRHLINGLAEVIKYGLIKEPGLLELILSKQDLLELPYKQIIQLSADIKSGIVNADPLENDLRKILNFGHTIGHAIESKALEDGEDLLHGEAIAIGMICESYISLRMKLIGENDYIKIENLILGFFGHHPDKVKDSENLIDKMLHDKKNQNSRILMSLINGAGSCIFNVEVSKSEIKDSLSHYRNLNYAK